MMGVGYSQKLKSYLLKKQENTRPVLLNQFSHTTVVLLHQ